MHQKKKEKRDKKENKEENKEPTKQNKRKFCVRLANVAYHATEDEIRDFFKPIPIPPNGITILCKGVKKTGHVFVKFACAEHAHEAEKRHEDDFLGRSVLVKTSYVQYLKTIWERVIGSGFPDDKFNEDTAGPRGNRDIIDSFFELIHQKRMTCLHVRNLPPDSTERDVYNILKRESVRIRKIDIIKDEVSQRCKGDAYVELEALEDCYRAVKLHEKVLFLGQRLQFIPITYTDLRKDLDTFLKPKYTDYRYPYAPPQAERPPVDDKLSYYSPASYAPYEKRARLDSAAAYPELAEPRPAHPADVYSHDRYRAPSPTPSVPRVETYPSRSPPSEYGRKYPYAAHYPGALPEYRGASALPSATVKMLNLSFEVTQEDIMEFFTHYSPIPKSVRLVYDAQSRLTGEGVLTFPSPEIAKAAVENLNGKAFLKRAIQLELD